MRFEIFESILGEGNCDKIDLRRQDSAMKEREESLKTGRIDFLEGQLRMKIKWEY